jgi:phosphate transport system substrate-binding protein
MRNLTKLALAALPLLCVPLVLWAAPQKGEIKCDGSSTVYLITEAVATNFKKQNPDVQISVGISGTGGGFKKFAAGETDISDASRKIKPAEQEACQKNKIDFVELQVAWDGLTVVIHPDNTWAKSLTVDQLKKIWHPDTAAKKWSDVDPTWPKEEIKLFGPGPDSGTFDFFTEAINGKEKVSRTDYQASEDDNTIVSGVEGNKYALGYFGLAYYEENKAKLQAVAIVAKDSGKAVLPTPETVLDKTYKPLSRPLFIYVNKASLARPEVVEFVKFYLRRNDLVKSAKYIPLNQRQLTTQQDLFDGVLPGAKK